MTDEVKLTRNQLDLKNSKEKLAKAYEHLFNVFSKSDLKNNKEVKKLREITDWIDAEAPQCRQTNTVTDDDDFMKNLTKEQANTAIQFAKAAGIVACTQQSDYSESLGSVETWCRGKAGGSIDIISTGLKGRAEAEVDCGAKGDLGSMQDQARNTGCEALVISLKNSVIASLISKCAVDTKKQIINTDQRIDQEIKIINGTGASFICDGDATFTQNITYYGEIVIQISDEEMEAITNVIDSAIVTDIDEAFEKVESNKDPVVSKIAEDAGQKKVDMANNIRDQVSQTDNFKTKVTQIANSFDSSQEITIVNNGYYYARNCNFTQETQIDLKLNQAFSDYSESIFSNHVNEDIKNVIKKRVSEITTYADKKNPAVDAIDSVTGMVENIAAGWFGSIQTGLIVLGIIAVVGVIGGMFIINKLLGGTLKIPLNPFTLLAELDQQKIILISSVVAILAGLLFIIGQIWANGQNDKPEVNGELLDINETESDKDGTQGFLYGGLLLAGGAGGLYYYYITYIKNATTEKQV